mgnify:CR=1 FL=1
MQSGSPPQEFPIAEVAQHPEAGADLYVAIAAATLAILVDGTSSATITAGLPYIAGISGATPDEASWFVTAFNAPYYATILLSPWLYARFGRKPLIMIGLLGYALCSLALALSSWYPAIVSLRFLEGTFLGCVFVPVVILLFTSLPLAAMRLAVPAFALVVLVAGALGTLIGGYLTETYGAAAIYVPSALATLVAAAAIWYYAPNYDSPQPQLRFDVVGYTLSLTLFGAMQYLANEGERRNWLEDPNVFRAIVVLTLAFPAFVAWELFYTRRPHANFRLFAAYRNLAVGSGINIVLGIVGYSVTVFSIFLQTVIASTTTLAGEVIALRTLTYIVGVFLAFVILSRRLIDVRIVVAIAAIATAVALYGFANAMTPTADAATFIGVSLAFGLVFAMLSQPVPALVIGALPLRDLPAGIAIYKLTVPIGLMAGTALVGTFIDHRAAFRASEIASAADLSRTAVSTFVGSGSSALVKLSGLITAQAQALAYRDSMLLFAAAVLLVVPLVIFAAPPAPRPPE